MERKDFRTYQRRKTTRESGYHTCGGTTGSECLILHAERYVCAEDTVTFVFSRAAVRTVELFEKGIAMLAFGGYLCSEREAALSLTLSYCYEGTRHTVGEDREQTLEAGSWSSIGIHAEQALETDAQLTDVVAKMTVSMEKGSALDLIAFDLDAVCKDEFQDDSCAVSFYQKTDMHVPYLYYLRTDLPLGRYLSSGQSFTKGKRIVLKSCNRCGRYLPINMDDELKTLSFSLHCKKRAPCVHASFRAYKIQNLADLTKDDLKGLTIEGDKVVSFFGHQLECKACKKFFVNAPLNPQRNAQQFKEDGLRRRAIEILVNTLLDKNLIHFEFARRTKREFSEYIWEKFDRRCFKCGPGSAPIALEDMALDHTMPLAYLYRLDETATCLCSSHNSQKSDSFPVDYYSEAELVRLSAVTGLSLEQLHKNEVNRQVLDLLVENVVWFYDDFLMNPDYQMVRDGIRTADKINDSLKRVIAGQADLVSLYCKQTGHDPGSVTIK